MLKIQKLTKKFGSFVAVDDISLHLSEGEFFGFLGPNGAGKTTTIKMITGLIAPTSGEILIDEIDTQINPIEAKRRIGYIPDQPFLYDKLTGKEYLYFSGGLYHLENSLLKERIDEAVETLRLGEWLNKRTENYSQGMKQRITIASALLHNPKFIIVDEPMVGLDPQSAKLVKDLFSQKAKEGAAILMSTHSLNIAEEICSRIGIIKDGKIIFDDNIEELKKFKAREYINLEHFFLELTQ